MSFAFGIKIDKDVVRRALAKHYRPEPGSGSPSWLTFLGDSKDSLWCADLFRCESLILKAHWVMVVKDATEGCKSKRFPLALSLSRFISAARRCLSVNSPQTGWSKRATSGFPNRSLKTTDCGVASFRM
jgi:hypothetical protein